MQLKFTTVLAGIALAVPTFGGSIYLTARNGGSGDLFQYDSSGVQTQNLKGNGLNNGQGALIGPNGNLLVVNEGGKNVLQYNPTTGAYLGVFATLSGFSGPMIVGPDGNVYVGGDGVVQRFDGLTGATLTNFASGVGSVSGIAFDAAGNFYAGNGVNGRVQKFNSSGSPLGTIISGRPELAYGTGALLFNGSNLLVSVVFGADGKTWGNQILSFDTNGTFQGVFASGPMLDGPFGMTFGPDGYLYVTNYKGGSVVRLTSSGNYVDTFIASTPDAPRNIVFAPDGAAPSAGVPEPASMALAGAGLFAVVALRSRKRS